jgi:hypothetical protein
MTSRAHLEILRNGHDWCFERNDGATICETPDRLQGEEHERHITSQNYPSIGHFGMAGAPGCAFSDTAPLIVIDAHNDTVQGLILEGADFGRRSSQGGIDLPRLQEGGVTVPFFAANVPVYYPEAEADCLLPNSAR